jgi:DNA-binding LacI/PurR family transcriptional regulator
MGTSRNRATLATVAARLGVTAMTVSNAYNRPEKLSAALRERIFAVAAELGYPGPDPVARSLRRGRTGAVGLLLGERLTYAFDDPSAVEFLAGLAGGCALADANLLLLSAGAGWPADTRVVDDAAVDAFVIWATPDGHPLIDAVRARGLPVVVHGGPRLPGVPFVSIDNRAAARAVMAHVLSTGRREVAVVSFPFAGRRGARLRPGPDRSEATHLVTRDRLDGFADALAEAGVDWSGVPVYEVAVNDHRQGQAAAAALLDAGHRPEAIVTMADQLACGVLRAAADRGIPVPDELAVTGWDDSRAATDVRPALTTVRQSLRDQGFACARAILDLPPADPGPAPADRWELVTRDSTGLR